MNPTENQEDSPMIRRINTGKEYGRMRRIQDKNPPFFQRGKRRRGKKKNLKLIKIIELKIYL